MLVQLSHTRGRVVIPKEIRRTMRIREGDPLEIFVSNEGEVIFKKYSPISELGSIAAQYCEVLYRTAGFPVLITERDHVVAVSGRCWSVGCPTAWKIRLRTVSLSLPETGSRCSPLRALPIMRWCSPLSSPPVMYAAA